MPTWTPALLGWVSNWCWTERFPWIYNIYFQLNCCLVLAQSLFPELVMDWSRSGDIQLAPGDIFKVTGEKKTQPCQASVSCNFCPVRARKWKLFPSLPHDCAQNSTIYFLSLFTSSPLYWLLCTKSPTVTCTLTLAFQNAWLWSSANTSNLSGATDQLNYSRSVSLCLFLSREQQLRGIKLEESLNFNHKL